MWNVSLSSYFIKLATTVPTRNSIVYLISWHDRLCLSHSIAASTTTSSSTSASTSRLSKGNGLSSSCHHGPELMWLSLPFRYWLIRLGLLNSFVDLVSSTSHRSLISIHHSLFSWVELFTFLRENLLAYIFVTSQSFRIKRSSTVVALFKSVSGSATTISTILLIRVCIRSQIVQVIILFRHSYWSHGRLFRLGLQSGDASL